MISLIYFLFALGVIVLVHEFGHLIVAKRNGVYCHEFSIGMGPKLKTFKTDKTGTVYNLRLIPLGGYVMMAGEETEKEFDVDVPKDQLLNNKRPWQKFKILIAGSTMNVILTVTLLILLSFFGGISTDSNQVEVLPDGNLAKVVNSSQITINEVNNQEVNSFAEIKTELDHSKKQVKVNYDNNQEVKLEKAKDGTIGITATVDKYRPLKSIITGFKQTIVLFIAMLAMIKELLSPAAGISDLSGPVGIYQMSSGVLDIGLSSAVMWIAYLSINIGVMNLLPIPALDGGRIVFVIYEMVTKKKVNQKIENYLIIGSMLLLLGLFVIVTFNDITRIF